MSYKIVGQTYDGVKVLAPKTKSKTFTPAEVRRSIRKAQEEVSAPDSDEDDEYLSIVWGILRRPIACTKCGQLTRTPSYWLGDQPSPPVCTPCFRISIWGF